MTTRLRRHELLSHPVRDEVFSLIQTHPGIPFLGLFQTLRTHPDHGPRLGYGSLSYHLHQLERFQLVTSRRAGRYRRYYENGGPQGGDTAALAILQTPPVPQLARLILDAPGLSQHELWQRFAEAHPCSRQSVSYQLLRLEKAALVRSTRDGRFKRYSASEGLRSLAWWITGVMPEPPAAAPTTAPDLGASGLAGPAALPA